MLKKKFKYSCYYMSSTSSVGKHIESFGFIFSIQTAPRFKVIENYPWCLDNDQFNDKFDFSIWCQRLIECLPYRKTCAFVVCPDKVKDWKETLRLFRVYAPIVRDSGYPVAFVTQDGLTIDQTPWNDFDVLFVGGSDEHKLTKEAGVLIHEAQQQNKWVHIGRVNSVKRLRQFWMANSWDGTHFHYEPSTAVPKFAAAVREIRELQKVERMF